MTTLHSLALGHQRCTTL